MSDKSVRKRARKQRIKYPTGVVYPGIIQNMGIKSTAILLLLCELHFIDIITKHQQIAAMRKIRK